MRTATITKEYYQYSELSDAAKQTAREWWIYCQASDFDAEFVLEDASTIAELMGIVLKTRAIPLMNGTTRPEPVIYYSGFWNRGGGACFEGSYAYRKGALKAVMDHAPRDETLHGIARDLQAIQRRNMYQLTASCTHRGHYYQHSGCMSVDVERDSHNYQDATADAEGAVTGALRSFADWIYDQLEAEYEYRTSDESAAESIEANGYEFDAEGNIT